MTSAHGPAGSFQITVQPSGRSFSVNPDEAILAGRHPPGHRHALRLQGRRLRLVQVQEARRHRGAWPAPEQGLSADEEAAGYVLTCCGVPQTDVVLESRQVTDESAFPVRKMPSRVTLAGEEVARRMVVKLQLPANDTMRYHAGQYVEFILRDGARRSYSMANAPHTSGTVRAPRDRTAHPPHARRQVHRPCVHRDEGKGDPAGRRARTAASTCARTPTSRWSCWRRAPASRRSRR